MDFTMFGNVSQENAQAQWDGEKLFDDAAQRASTLRFAEPFDAKKLDCAVIGMQGQTLFQQATRQFVHLQTGDSTSLLMGKRAENHDFIDTIEKFWPECLAQALQQA